MKLWMSYREDVEVVSDIVAEHDEPSMDAEFDPETDALICVKVGIGGGTVIEITAQEIADLVKAGFNL